MKVRVFVLHLLLMIFLTGCSSLDLEENSIIDEEVRLPVQNSSALFGTTVNELGNLMLYRNVELEDKVSYWKSVNKDVCALLVCEELGIEEPVVQATKSNTQWLRTNIFGTSDVAGTIFLDVRCNVNEHAIKMIHGHNMQNGKMFAPLPQMLQYTSVADAPLFHLVYETGVADYQVYSVIAINTKEEALPLDRLNTKEQTELVVQDLLKRSCVPGGKITSLDTLVLNTCWYGKSGRDRNLHCIVVASRVVQ